MTGTPEAGASPEAPAPTFAEILIAHHPAACGTRINCMHEMFGHGWHAHMENILAVAAQQGIHPALQNFPAPSAPAQPRKPTQFRGGRTPGKPKTPKGTP